MEEIPEIPEQISQTLEKICYNFDPTFTLMKTKIADIDKVDKLILNFNYLLIAMSKNGGLFAICKKPKYKEFQKTKITDYLIVMHQEGTNKYLIPFSWNYTQKYIVSLEFNEKEQLYAFCNDGTIFKIDIFIEEAIEKTTSSILKEEGIYSVKLFENGFICLTEKGNIYLIKDIKDPQPIFIISLKTQLNFSNKADYYGIPSSKSKSGKFELLILNEKGPGVLRVIEGDFAKNSSQLSQSTFNPGVKGIKTNKTLNVSIIKENSIENYVPEIMNPPEVNEKASLSSSSLPKVTKDKDLGIIKAIAFSPSGEEIAMYCPEKQTAFIFPTSFDKNQKLQPQKMLFTPDTDEYSTNQVNEQKAILNYDNEGCQFLFCGKNNLAISGKRFIIISCKNKKTIIYQIEEENEFEALSGANFCKCVSEIDGLRYLTNDEVCLITNTSKDFNDFVQLNESYGLKLMMAYTNAINGRPCFNKQIKEIEEDLPNAINFLQIMSANILWLENRSDQLDFKKCQDFIMRAAQFGKKFVNKENFNYDKFINNCRNIRILNNLRNWEGKPRYLTYEEFLSMNPDNPIKLLKMVLRQYNFDLAYEICNYLSINHELVYQAYALANIKALPLNCTITQQERTYREIIEKIKDNANISYITLAKKSIKYGKFSIAEKFLEKEKSVTLKIPQYLQLKKWDETLKLCLQCSDKTFIKIILDKLFKLEGIDSFLKIVKPYNEFYPMVIEYLKKSNKKEELQKFLTTTNNYEDLLSMTLELYFSSKTILDRNKYLKECKVYNDKLKNINNNSYLFFKQYLGDLQNSLKFKKSCLDPQNQILDCNALDEFDNSIYDCYEKGIETKYNWIKEENKKHFNISQRKLTILRFRALLKKKDIDAVEKAIQDEGLKSLDMTPMCIAQVLNEFNYNDKAVEYILQVKDNTDYDSKVELLKKMGKLKEALEIVISDKKNNEKMLYHVNDICRKNPALKSTVNELCAKYKVNLG